MKCGGSTRREFFNGIHTKHACFLHAPSTIRKLSPMILGFYTRLAHRTYTKCEKVLVWKLPFFGHCELWTWDDSANSSMAVRHDKLAEYLAAPSKWD